MFERLYMASTITLAVYFIISTTVLLPSEKLVGLLIPLYNIYVLGYAIVRSFGRLAFPLNEEETAFVNGRLSRESKMRRLKKESKELKAELAQISPKTLEEFSKTKPKPENENRAMRIGFYTAVMVVLLLAVFAAVYFFLDPASLAA